MHQGEGRNGEKRCTQRKEIITKIEHFLGENHVEDWPTLLGRGNSDDELC